MSTESESGEEWDHAGDDTKTEGRWPPRIVVLTIVMTSTIAVANLVAGTTYLLDSPDRVVLGVAVLVFSLALLGSGVLLWRARPTVWLVMVVLVAALFLLNGTFDLASNSLTRVTVFLLIPAQFLLGKLPSEYK